MQRVRKKLANPAKKDRENRQDRMNHGRKDNSRRQDHEKTVIRLGAQKCPMLSTWSHFHNPGPHTQGKENREAITPGQDRRKYSTNIFSRPGPTNSGPAIAGYSQPGSLQEDNIYNKPDRISILIFHRAWALPVHSKAKPHANKGSACMTRTK